MPYIDQSRFAAGQPEVQPESEPTASFGLDADQPRGRLPPDRIGVHLCLEAVLLLGFAILLFALFRSDAAPFATGQRRDAMIVVVVALLLTAMASAVALRVGTVNLAVGAIAAGAGMLFAENTARGLPMALAIALGAALAAGAVLVLLAVVLRAPGWLAGAAVTGVIALWLWQHVDLTRQTVAPLSSLAASQAWIWLVSIGALSIVGGVVGALGGWRSRLGECRKAAASGGRRDGATIATTITALLMSALLAGMAGVWLIWTAAPTQVFMPMRLDPVLLTGFGLAAALLGGTSALGRRGGILGTLAASLLLATVLALSIVDEWRLHPLWLILAAIGVGIIVTRLVDTLGRPDRRWHDDEPPTMMEPARYDATVEEYDARYRGADIDPYRGAAGHDGYRYQ
ncbi:MAG: hypothetical protein ACRD0P_09845 [Stackebrandtia sp.]